MFGDSSEENSSSFQAGRDCILVFAFYLEERMYEGYHYRNTGISLLNAYRQGNLLML